MGGPLLQPKHQKRNYNGGEKETHLKLDTMIIEFFDQSILVVSTQRICPSD